jgi:ABC-type Mn2+/Zn2+ transport system permease subunit
MKTKFAIVFIVFFAISIIGISTAQEKPYSFNHSFTGEVTAVDFLGKDMTVKAAGTSTSLAVLPGEEFTFTLNEKTSVMMCNEPKTLDSIKAGERVTVNYHEEDGKLYASKIALDTPLVACLIDGSQG